MIYYQFNTLWCILWKEFAKMIAIRYVIVRYDAVSVVYLFCILVFFEEFG